MVWSVGLSQKLTNIDSLRVSADDEQNKDVKWDQVDDEDVATPSGDLVKEETIW